MLEGGTNFDQPPVQTTVLTAFFEPITLFDLSFILPLQRRWAERYPELRQKVPRGRPSVLPDVDVSDLGALWPLPAIEQQNRELSRSISYQADQFSLSWQLDPKSSDPKYPGFAALYAEFQNLFHEFVEQVQSMAKPLKVQGGRCSYENCLTSIAGVDYIAQYLSDFSDVEALRRMPSAEYVGFRFNEEPSETPEGSQIRVSVQLDSPKDKDTTLDIDVIAVPVRNSPIDGGEAQAAAARLIEDAHHALVTTFLKSVSSDMQRGWRKR